MSSNINIYEFEKFELDPAARTLYANDGTAVELTEAEYELLLFFVLHPQIAHLYQDLYEEVFGLEGKSQENTIPAHVSNLRKKLRKHSTVNLIKNIPNYGYRFECTATIKERRHSASVTLTETTDFSDASEILELQPGFNDSHPTIDRYWNGRSYLLAAIGLIGACLFYLNGRAFSFSVEYDFEKSLFFTLACLGYGALFGIGLLLESAYEFDKLGWKAARLVPPVILLNAGAMFFALALANYYVKKNRVFWDFGWVYYQ